MQKLHLFIMLLHYTSLSIESSTENSLEIPLNSLHTIEKGHILNTHTYQYETSTSKYIQTAEARETATLYKTTDLTLIMCIVVHCYVNTFPCMDMIEASVCVL